MAMRLVMGWGYADRPGRAESASPLLVPVQRDSVLSPRPGSSTSGVGVTRMGFAPPLAVGGLFWEVLIVALSACKR